MLQRQTAQTDRKIPGILSPLLRPLLGCYPEAACQLTITDIVPPSCQVPQACGRANRQGAHSGMMDDMARGHLVIPSLARVNSQQPGSGFFAFVTQVLNLSTLRHDITNSVWEPAGPVGGSFAKAGHTGSK